MNNKALYKLLIKNPQKFIASDEVIEVIRKTAYRFASKGGIDSLSKEDLVQEILFVILEKKINYIVKNYNPKVSTIQGYMSKVAFNICIELLRKQQTKPVLKNSLDDETEGNLEREFNNITPESSLIEKEIIEKEIQRLKSYLKIFAKYKYKFIFLLKLYCRIPLIIDDLQNFAPKVPLAELEGYLSKFSQEYSKYSDKEIYKIITPLVNKVEGKKSSSDSIRKWIDGKILTLKEVMNQSTHYQYDTESFKNLIRLL